jgi:hypothetical protein
VVLEVPRHAREITGKTRLVVPQELDAGGACAGERQLDSRRLGQNRQVAIPITANDYAPLRRRGNAPPGAEYLRAACAATAPAARSR